MSAGLIFEPDIATFIGERSSSIITVLSGGNNSGKSATLKRIKSQIGRSAYLIGPVRFYHVNQISTQQKDPNEINNLESQFQNTFSQVDVNHEQNFLDLTRIITNLSNKGRDMLFSICENLIGSKFSLKQVDPENELSMRYIDMDGKNLGLGSTGTRLLMTLLGICMDVRFSTILIDEPELGLSPKVQEAFSDFLQNEAKRSKLFPHLKNIYISTHSHLFLDRKEPKNNFVVSLEGEKVSIVQISSVSEFHRLQFNLLGNSLERISLPSAIIIVEGPSDYKYIKRIVELNLPNKRITIVEGQGDVKAKVHSIVETLGGDLQKSPYQNRLFVVNDSITSPGLKDSLSRMGITQDRFITWDKNGIEYVYPPAILAEIFTVSEDSVMQELQITDDTINVRGSSRKKMKLSEEIVAKITKDTKLPEELIRKLLKPLLAAIT